MDGTGAAAEEKKVLPIKTTRPPLTKKRRKHKPKDFPKRPLSAYNIFFKETREQILSMREGNEELEGESSDFQSMVKEIAARWKALGSEERTRCEVLAKEDLQRYKDEVAEYEEKMVMRSRQEREESELQRKKDLEAASAAGKAAHGSTNRESDVAAAGTILPDRLSSNSARRADNIEDLHYPSSSHAEENDLEKILIEEVNAMEVVRNCKARQMRVCQSLRLSNPHILVSLDSKRVSLGLPPLLAAEGQEMGLMATLRAGVGVGGLQQQSLSRTGAAREGSGLAGAFLPPTSGSSHMFQSAEEEANILRNYSLRLREQELRNLHQQSLQQNLLLGQDPAAEFTAQRSLLATATGGVNPLDLYGARSPYDTTLLPQVGGLSSLSRLTAADRGGAHHLALGGIGEERQTFP